MEPQELAPLAQMDPTPPEMDPDLPPPPPHQTLATLTVASEQPPPPEKKESRDALAKPSAPPFDQAEIPLKQKISSRAREAILKWKANLPSPPTTISLDGSLGTDISKSMWDPRTYKSSPQGRSSRSISPTPRPQTTPSLTAETESLQVLLGPLRHIAERDQPSSYPLVEHNETPLLKSAKLYQDMEISGGLAHFIPSNILMKSGVTRPICFGAVSFGTPTTGTNASPALTPNRGSPESSRAPPPAPPPQSIWPFRSFMYPHRISRILGKKKVADDRPVGVQLVPLSTSFAETQTPPERTRDSKGTIVRRDRRHHKERSRRKDRPKSRDRYEEIMEIDYKSYDSDDEDMSCGHWCEYVIVVVLSSILLVASVVLVLFWCLYYRKGYAWNDNPTVQFNLHPTLMITGFVFFSGFSMLLYRISRCCRRIYVKLLHTLFHTLAIPCVVLGFMAVLDSHNLADPPIPNFYSIHSWMGFVTMGLFALQFVVGFFSFLLLLCCDSATAGFRASLVPVHATFGLTTFMLAIATCLTGLTEKAYFNFGTFPFPSSSPKTDDANSTEFGIEKRFLDIGHIFADYSNYPDEAIIMNALAMVLVALAILVSYAVRREPLRVHSISYVSERL